MISSFYAGRKLNTPITAKCYLYFRGFEFFSKNPYGYLSTMAGATSLQRPLFLVPGDSPYIPSYFVLSITATATKTRPNYQNNLVIRPVNQWLKCGVYKNTYFIVKSHQTWSVRKKKNERNERKIRVLNTRFHAHYIQVVRDIHYTIGATPLDTWQLVDVSRQNAANREVVCSMAPSRQSG